MAEALENEANDNAMEMLTFTFQISPAKYAARFGVEIPDDSADATLTSEDESVITEDAATVSYGKRMLQFAPGSAAATCKTTLQNCQAQNPMTCRFHGAKVIAQDIEAQIVAAFQAGGQPFTGNVNVELERVTATGILTCTASVTAPIKDRALVKAGLDNFFKMPGVDGDTTMLGRGSGGYDNPFEIDMLDPNAKARWGMGQAAPAAAVAAQTKSSSAPAPTPAPQPAPASAPTSPAPTPTAQPTPSSQPTAAAPQPAAASQTPAAPKQTPAAATQAPAPKAKRQKTLRGISKIAADKKDLAALRSAGGDKKVCDDIEKMIDEKEKAITSMDSIDKTLKQAPASIQPGYQKVRDALFKKIKDLSDKIDDGIDKEDAAVQAKSAGKIQPGDSAATVKNKLMALKKAGKIKFVPKMLDKIDSRVKAQLDDLRQTIQKAMPEISNDQTWDQLQDLVSKSLAAYLGRCEYRTYCGANTILNRFLATSTYNPSTSLSFNRGYYGVTDMGERGTCCSTTIPNHDPFDPNVQSAWDQWRSDRACVRWRKETTAIAYSCMNLGSAGGLSRQYGANGSLITSPSITSLGYHLNHLNWYGSPSQQVQDTINWFRGMLKSGQPDLNLDRTTARRILSGNHDHDECHAFSGNAKNGEHLKHVEAFEFLQKSDAEAAVRQYGKTLKDNGIKVYWGNSQTEVPNP